jgi:hypothetical protein
MPRLDWTTRISLLGFSPVTSSRVSRSLAGTCFILLSAALPLTALSQATTSAPTASAPTILENLSVTPKFGQTALKLASDRDECQLWAKGQTGFDPGQYSGGVSPTEYSARRQTFGRAMAACLEGHGYSVSFVAPAPAQPPYGRPPPPPPPPPPPLAVITPANAPYGRPPAPELKYHPLAVHIDGGYTATTGATGQNFDDGANAGLGLSWFPTSLLPIGVRIDGSYNWLPAKDALLNAGNFTSGHEDIYGGDADLQLNLAHRSSRAQFYLFGGAGWYREHTAFRQLSYSNATLCGYFFCRSFYFPEIAAEQRATSDWHHAWNAGLGFEVAIADGASFFLEARYLRILPNSNQTKFIPVTLGLRF